MARVRRQLVPLLLVIGLSLAGVASAAYVLINARLPVPFQSTYGVRVQLIAANGVAPGLGQPVLVSGVEVGLISSARLEAGSAQVGLQIARGKLPHIYRNASAVLTPTSPLDDMEIDLDPGTPQAGIAPRDWLITSALSQSPVQLSDLLGSLDSDTRDYLTTMIASLGQGLDGRGADLRRMLGAFSATTVQLKTLSQGLAQRREQLARLVHNLALVMGAASQDRELTSLVVAGQRTLAAVAGQDRALGSSLDALPATLNDARFAVDQAAVFAGNVADAQRALAPALQRLPGALRTFTPFGSELTRTLATEVRPLVRTLPSLLRQVGPAVVSLHGAVPSIRGIAELLTYIANELAYQPPGDDQGYLFWLAWFAHITNSAFSSQDAHGSLGRASVLVSCQQLSDLASLGSILKIVLGVSSVCP